MKLTIYMKSGSQIVLPHVASVLHEGSGCPAVHPQHLLKVIPK